MITGVPLFQETSTLVPWYNSKLLIGKVIGQQIQGYPVRRTWMKTPKPWATMATVTSSASQQSSQEFEVMLCELLTTSYLIPFKSFYIQFPDLSIYTYRSMGIDPLSGLLPMDITIIRSILCVHPQLTDTMIYIYVLICNII